MKLLDYTNRDFEELELKHNTAMIMCFTRKIILFETAEELNKFKRVWEDIIIEYLEKYNELDPEYLLEDSAYLFVDHFEEESWFIRDYENGKCEHSPRNLKVVDNSKDSDENYIDEYEIRFAILNSGDIFIDIDYLKMHVELLDLLFEKEEMYCRLDDTMNNMIKIVHETMKEELEQHGRKDRKYFKVKVIGD